MAEFIEYVAGEKFPAPHAHRSDSMDAFDDCGKIIPTNMLIVDLDEMDRKLFDAIIKEFNINTEWWETDDGFHLWFKKPEGFSATSGIVAGGFTAEFKTNKNKSITVKRFGKERVCHNAGTYEPLPEIFFKKSARRFFTQDMLGVGEGSRNDMMFKHAMELNGAVRGREKILRFINDYVIAKPLTEKEIENILKREVTAQKDGEFLMARQITSELKCVMYRGELYYYDGFRYVSGENDVLWKIRKYCPEEKKKYIKEIYDQICLDARKIDINASFTIKFQNGFLDKGQFIELEDYDEFTPYAIDARYNPKAKPVELVDQYINNLTENEPEYRDLLLEILGHALITDPQFKRTVGGFFFFHGDGGNGKGTLLDIYGEILGDDNVSWMSPKQIHDARYQSQLNNTLANLGDDIEKGAIDDDQMKALKNISTCDKFSSRVLFAQGQTVRYTSTLIFTTNHPMKSFEKGEAFKRRVKFLPMKFKPAKKDPLFVQKLTTDQAIEYWVKLMVDGYLRLYKNGQFTVSPIVDEYTEESHFENDTILQFIKSDVVEREDLVNRRVSEAYESYTNFCRDDDAKPRALSAFREAMKKEFDLEIGKKSGNSSFLEPEEAKRLKEKAKAKEKAKKEGTK